MILQVASMEIVLQCKSTIFAMQRKENNQVQRARGSTSLLVQGIVPRQRDTLVSVVTAPWPKFLSPFLILQVPFQVSQTLFSLPNPACVWRPELTRSVHSSLANTCIQKESTRFLSSTGFTDFSHHSHLLIRAILQIQTQHHSKLKSTQKSIQNTVWKLPCWEKNPNFLS